MLINEDQAELVLGAMETAWDRGCFTDEDGDLVTLILETFPGLREEYDYLLYEETPTW